MQSWSQSHEGERVPLALYAIIGMSCVLVRQGQLTQGVELLATAQAHEKTPAIYLDPAERWFEGVRDDLGAGPCAEAVARGEARNLDQVIETLLHTEPIPAAS